MPAMTVVEELVVLLRLNSEPYKKADREIDKSVATTEKKLKKVDEARTKRMHESTRAVKQFATSMRALALTVGGVLGVGGGAAGLVQAVIALTNFEVGLRRLGVSTGQSNRTLQAWGSTAARLGADAEAGRAALAGLAKEQRQFHMTGQAPTLQAFARMGINVSPDAPIEDMLANAQRVYRSSSKAQQGQIEAGLSASGVSDEIITMIKSEKDVRAEFARSFAESASENRKALDAVSSALEAAKNSALNVANALMSLVQPHIDQFGQWLSGGAQQLSAFVDKVIAAGGGVDGFMRVMGNESPELARLLRGAGSAAGFLKDVLDVVVFGFKKLAAAADAIYTWVEEKIGKIVPAGVKGAVADFGDGVAKGWRMVVGEAHDPAGRSGGGVLLTPQTQARIAAGEGATASASATAPTGAAAGRPSARATRDDVIRHLIGMGLTVDQAAAMAANIQGESNFDPTAINKSSGAAGLMQYLSKDRVADFQRRYGTTPDKAPWQTQLNFLKESPAEWSRLQRSMSGGKSAADYGAGISRVFEAHGNVAEDARRAQLAVQYAREYKAGGGTTGSVGGPASPTIGQQINVQSVTVQANNAQEFATSVSRVGGATNYNSATR